MEGDGGGSNWLPPVVVVVRWPRRVEGKGDGGGSQWKPGELKWRCINIWRQSSTLNWTSFSESCRTASQIDQLIREIGGPLAARREGLPFLTRWRDHSWHSFKSQLGCVLNITNWACADLLWSAADESFANATVYLSQAHDNEAQVPLTIASWVEPPACHDRLNRRVSTE